MVARDGIMVARCCRHGNRLNIWGREKSSFTVVSKHGQVEDRRIVEDMVETLFFIPYIGLPSVICGRKLREIPK